MTPEVQLVINCLLVLTSALLGWYLKVIHQAMRDLQTQDQALADKVQSIELLVAGEYVKRSEMDRFGEAMFKKLDRIENKLDGKVDR